ncbi:MAG: type IV secretory system conjugative DNA transfer family protein [Clostridium sp.]
MINRANKEIKLASKLADKKLLSKIIISIFLAITLFINLIINSTLCLIDKISGINESFNILYLLFRVRIFSFPIFYIIAYIITGVAVGKIMFNIKASFSDIKEGQKGTMRFTTSTEIEEQYKAVNELESDEELANGGYDGEGGVVISRDKDKIFIDDSPVNNLIIGITRSGKGEMFIFPTIDVYSRAKNKPSLIINDPKGELVASSIDTFEKRGYRVETLNLVEPLNSMSYNPLQLIIDAYEKKKYSEAQSLCKTLTYTLYYKPGTKDPFWQNSAMSLVNALILAIIDQCLEECNELETYKNDVVESNDSNKEKILIEIDEKIRNIKAKRTLYTIANMLAELGSKEDNLGNNELDKYFSKLKPYSVAKMQYATSNFAKGTTRGGIFSTAMSELQIFTMDEIAKMTSVNSVDLKDIGFKNKEDDRPIAVFMVIPDYDVSNHVIASIFVRQLYYVLAKEASQSKNGKCEREVVFMLDEFGNMPAIEGMSSIITVCLGRNIRFNLVIQAYSQLEEKYGKGYKTIVGNCGNQIYILTNENETAEEFSKLIGEETIVTYSRSGEILDSTKHQTESLDGRRLKKYDELKLEEGENIVVRVIKRRDLKGNKITPYPIFNKNMKYRYEYLNDYFDTSKTLLDVKVETLHKDIKLQDLLLFHNDIEAKGIEKSSSKWKVTNVKEEVREEDERVEREIVISEIFTMDEVFKIREIVEKYFKGVKIEPNTKWSSFELFVEKENNDELKAYIRKGIEELEKRGDIIGINYRP